MNTIKMMTFFLWWQAWFPAVRQTWRRTLHTRWQTVAGVEGTGETIGWLIAAIILVIIGVGFALGPGSTWVNGILDTVTQISTSST